MRPLGFREAAEFWGVAADSEVAFRLHALVGGTPEYKANCGGAGPQSPADFDRWVQRWLLDPAGVLFDEGRLPPGEQLAGSDPASRAAALGAICAGVGVGAGAGAGVGVGRASEIAAALGRPEPAVADVLAALTAIGLIERLQDPLNGERSGYVIVKPIARLRQLVIAPYEPELAAGQADRVWALSRETVAARIYRPHFASVARQWCLRHAAGATLGGVARAARPTAIACREHRREHELEAVLVGDPAHAGRIIAIGETNAASGPMDAGQLRRLEHLRALLPGERVGRPPRLLLFSRGGFAAGLAEEAADRRDVELVELERIYQGT